MSQKYLCMSEIECKNKVGGCNKKKKKKNHSMKRNNVSFFISIYFGYYILYFPFSYG